MAEKSANFKLLTLGTLIHVLYLSSVFYIYFKSPILSGLSNIKSQVSPSAKRLVLFVADGLQAEKAFHRENEKQTLFLRHIIKDVGRWGVSHTRVPTESRVGHVSLLAGTYEDVSAITNGWKVNPVEFDSLFNRSFKSWCWGSPDILNIFDKKIDGDNIESFSYDSEEIDFASSDPSKLDQWVFDHVVDFLRTAKSNKKLSEELQAKEIVFFLHLLGIQQANLSREKYEMLFVDELLKIFWLINLVFIKGIDTNGHSKKPDSVEYLNNIALVNEGIWNITMLFNEFYTDGKTAFVVTSDHGMTPWGAHGTGLASETETPFIAWGSGISKPVVERSINSDRQSMIWGLEDYLRVDIKQIDLAPLMSFLLGLSFPVNSVGVLPHQVLDADDRTKALGMQHNVKQIKEQYDAHENKIKHSRFFFTPFESNDAASKIIEISKDINIGKYQTAIEKSEILIGIFLKGIDYYHTYNRWSLSLCVNFAFVAWLMLLILTVLQNHTEYLKRNIHVHRPWILKFIMSNFFSLVYFASVIAACMVLFAKSRDFSHVMYSSLPLLMARVLLSKVDILWSVMCRLLTDLKNGRFYFGVFLYVILVLAGIEILVMAFFNRGVLSVIGFCLSIIPWLKVIAENNTTKFTILQKSICVLFTLTSLLLSIFPQLPVIQREPHYLLVVTAGFIIATGGVIYTFLVKSRDSMVIGFQTLALVLCVVVKMHSVSSIEHGHGLPRTNQMFSWSVLLLFPVVVFMTDGTTPARLFSIVLSLSSVYTLTSISYELLFLLVLTVQLMLWCLLEVYVFSVSEDNLEKSRKTNRQQQQQRQQLDLFTKDHIRIAFMFVYYIFVSFFGTGNIASINSFDISSTYCFQTVFNPWIQGVVLATKVLVPFLMVNFMFRSMQSMTSIPISHALFLVILILTDLMSIHFFFLVKDEGSWLEIGQSLSHFIITLAFVIFLVPVYGLSYFVSGAVSLKEKKEHTM